MQRQEQIDKLFPPRPPPSAPRTLPPPPRSVMSGAQIPGRPQSLPANLDDISLRSSTRKVLHPVDDQAQADGGINWGNALMFGALGTALGAGIAWIIGNQTKSTEEISKPPKEMSDECKGYYYNMFCKNNNDGAPECTLFGKRANECKEDSKDDFCKIVSGDKSIPKGQVCGCSFTGA